MLDRELWYSGFVRSEVPKFPCPKCLKGRLLFALDTLSIEVPKYSKDAISDLDWEPEWLVERFTAVMRCDESKCGEVVALVGDTGVVEDYDESGDSNLIEVLCPQAIFPPPPIFSIDPKTPPPIAVEIKKAFWLFWSDLDASANRLRVSVEMILDHFKVPTEARDKRGKLRRLDLHGRIELFNTTAPEHTETLTALRMIGNLGSHGSGVVRDALLDACEVFEDCLAELFGQKKQRMDSLKKKLIAAKGKYA